MRPPIIIFETKLRDVLLHAYVRGLGREPSKEEMRNFSRWSDMVIKDPLKYLDNQGDILEAIRKS